MSQHSDLPPNPREARRGYTAPTLWSLFPLTVFLAVVSIMVAGLTNVGDKAEDKAGFLFFSEPLTEEQEHVLIQKILMERAAEASERLSKNPEAEYLDGILSDRNTAASFRDEFLRRQSFTSIKQGEVWRLVTPIFLHFSMLHIVFNMLWLWDLGRVLEGGMRTLRFSLLVLAIAVISNLTQAIVGGPRFGGMSGVVYGLFGFMIVRARFHPAGGVTISKQNTVFMLIWLGLGFTGMVGPIANGAHLAGLLTGAAIGFAVAMKAGGWQHIKRRREFRQAIASSSDTLHSCAVCGKTEADDPNLEFRVCSDGEEYCEQHLPR